MGGGSGGILNKLVPGYKDKIWRKLPAAVQSTMISRQSRTFEKQLKRDSHENASDVLQYNLSTSRSFSPSYSSRAPVTDYKRQYFRGTLVEGADSYNGTARLAAIDTPYSDSEEAVRSGYDRYDLRVTLALILAGLALYDYKKSRPIVWCGKTSPAWPRYPWYHKSWYACSEVKAVRRGFEVYRQVCGGCHTLKKCKWWYLMKDIYPVRRVQEFAYERMIPDGLTDDGELNMRPSMTWDYFPSAFPTRQAAKEANNGKEPPDFSMGPNWIIGGCDRFFGILTGYRDPPVGMSVLDGTWYNTWFHLGSVIGMPPPLEPGLVEYEDGTPSSVPQMAKDVVQFLFFIADPQIDQKKLMAMKGLAFLFAAWVPVGYIARQVSVNRMVRRLDLGKIKLL